MKNYIKSVCFILLYLTGNSLLAQTQTVIIPPGGPCPDINVSTGIDLAGNSIAVGATDPKWIIASGPMGPATKRTISFPGAWEPTPVLGTNACWINGSGTLYNNAAGIYEFTRDFNINAGTVSFTTNFSVAWDDVLVSLELVPPSPGLPIPLTVPPAPPYMLGAPITYTVMAPATGTWKIRAVVRFIDQIGGFLLSGSIDIDCNDNPCTCENVYPTFTYSTDTDCITTFVGTINPVCNNATVQYQWIIDGVPSGFGQVFSTALPNGTHVVCLVVTVVVNGHECLREWCTQVTIDCNPCSCDKLIPEFLYTIDKCEGHFTGTADIPCCIKEIKYEWYIDGIYQFTGQNFNHTFTANGFYNVCLFISGTLPDGTECHKQICKLVEVKDCGCNCDQLQPSFTYQLFGCEAVFNSTTTAPECMQIISEEWYVNGLPVGGGPSLTYVFPANGPYNICLFVTAVMADGTVCQKEYCQQINVKDCGCNCDQIEVNYDYFIEGCTGFFNGLVGLPACLQIIGWDWSVNGTPVGSGPSLTYTFPGNGTYNVCLMVTSQMPDGSICHEKICKLVTVVNCGCNCDQLQIDFNYEIDKCNIYLYGNAQGSPCMQDFQYQWTVNGTTVGFGQNFVWTAPHNGTYTICLFVTVTLSDGTKCYKEICKTITVTDCDECTCEGFGLDYTYQIGQCVGYFNGTVNLPPCWVNYTIDWYVNGSFAGSGASFVYNFPSNGVYQVCMVATVTLSNGIVCQDRVCRTFDVAGCGCSCSQLGGTFNFQVNGCNIFLQAQPQVPPCMSGVGYTWIVNGSYAGSAPVFNYPVTGNGIYTVCLWITAVLPTGQKCEFQACKTIVVNNCGIGTPTDPQGIAPPGPVMEESLQLYPNPASTELNIDFKTADAGTVTIIFKTMDGKEILNQSKDLEAGDQHLKMPISPMISDEIIFVEITTGTETIVRKVSVSKRE